MHRYKLLALDLDGTLLNPRRKITPYTYQILHQAVAAGLQLVIATGQTLHAMRVFCAQLPLCGPQILYNGALVLDIQSEEVFYEQLLPDALILPALATASELRLYRVYHTRQHVYFDSDTPGAQSWYLPPIPPSIEVADVASLYPQPCIKLAAVGPAQHLREQRAELERRFAGQLYITQSSRTLLEFLHPAVSKGEALAQLARQLGIAEEEVVAIGDNHNDMGMLRFAGLGIAMGNAHDEVKAAADYVTLSNAEDGAALAIERLVLRSGYF